MRGEKIVKGEALLGVDGAACSMGTGLISSFVFLDLRFIIGVDLMGSGLLFAFEISCLGIGSRVVEECSA